MAGKQCNTTTITDDGILTWEEITSEQNWGSLSLFYSTRDKLLTLKWCARRQLIKNKHTCGGCGQSCSLQENTPAPDGYVWSCLKCNNETSVRDKSFFSGSHLHIQKILLLTYNWCHEYQTDIMASDCNVEEEWVTVHWCKRMRDECSDWLNKHCDGIGGTDENGEAIVVEISESKFFHRKYPIDDYRREYWIFGGIERLSGKCFLVEVKDRATSTIQACITQNILPGSHIISHEWASYANIETIDQGVYQHTIINDVRNLSETRNMENLWLRAKTRLRLKIGTDEKEFKSYFFEFLLRNFFRTIKRRRYNDIFSNFIVVLSQNYKL